MNELIRPAVATDVERLVSLTKATINACYRSFLGDEAVDAFIGGGEVERYFQDHLHNCVVIVRDDRTAGVLGVRDSLIDLLMIDHTVHRQGLGRALLAHAEESLFRRYPELTVESFARNEVANAFYRRLGWRAARNFLDAEHGIEMIAFVKSAQVATGRVPDWT